VVAVVLTVVFEEDVSQSKGTNSTYCMAFGFCLLVVLVVVVRKYDKQRRAGREEGKEGKKERRREEKREERREERRRETSRKERTKRGE